MSGLRSWWFNRSIRGKLALPFALVIGTISVFVYVYFPATIARREEAALRARGQSIATISAFTLSASEVLGDQVRMIKALGGAFENEEVTRAEVRSRAGTILMAVTPTGVDGLAVGKVGRPPPAGALVVTAPILRDGVAMGRLLLTLSQGRLVRETERMRRTTLLVSLVIFMVGVLALVLLSALITRPLLQIVRTSERIAGGDLDRRAAVATGDEVGHLAGAFNVMLDRLQATQRELRLVNRDLERRVEEELSARQRVEREKDDLEQLYAQILDSLPLEIAVFDEHRRYLYLNPAAVTDPERRAEMLGLRPEQAGSPAQVGDETVARRSAAIERCLSEGEIVSFEETREDWTGQVRHFIRVYSPMRSSDGQVSRAIGYGVDITNRRQAEEALRQSEEKLRQSQKMESIGRLAGGIAHDFNNLLTVISGHAELLMAETSAEDPSFEELAQMKRAADRAAGLTRQLLAFSRRQVLRPRLLDVNGVVAEVEQMLARVIGEHIQLVTVLRPGVGQVRADPTQVEQVLLNLAVNARDAMPEGGTLTIETDALDQQEIAARWGDHVDEGRYVVLSVRDTGIGINREDRELVFEPFFTTKDVGKGTGLGLSTVYGVVKQSGGFVYLDSEVGLGTSFRVYLRQVWAPEEVARTVRAGGALPGGGPETILLVEDEPLVRELTETILARSGYDVLVASGPHEALGLARDHGGAIDLLFTDVVMPGMGGQELATRVRAMRPETKVLFMSGYTDDALVDEGVLGDGIALLQKPFTTDKVSSAVRSALDGGSLEMTAD